jgi:hypothetical protein
MLITPAPKDTPASQSVSLGQETPIDDPRPPTEGQRDPAPLTPEPKDPPPPTEPDDPEPAHIEDPPRAD